MPLIKTTDAFTNWRMKVLLYGRSGTGKTYLAGTAALVREMCPIYFVATERGYLSIRSLVETGRIQIMLANSGADLVALQNVVASPGRFKTIIIDSLSELHALIIQTEQKGDEPNRHNYQVGHDKILKLLRYIDRHATVHVIVTANDQPLIDGESGRVLSMDPDMAGKLSFRATRYFDLVGYTSARSVASLVPDKPPTIHRSLQVQNYDGIAAKDRTQGRLGAVVSEPTMAKLYTALVGPCTELPVTRVEDPEVLA